MELATFDWQSASFILLATFGSVSAVNFWKKQESKVNFAMSVGFALVFSFVPTDLGSFIANKVKDALTIALTLNGAYQGLGGIVRKIGNE